MPLFRKTTILAVEPRLQLADALDVDDVGAVDAEEQVGIELRLDRVHRLAEQVRVGADVELDVVAGRLDPVDLAGADEEHAAAGLDDEPFERLRGRLQPVHEREQPAFEVAVGAALDVFPRPRSRPQRKRSRSNGLSR